jgi:hypothetical protein
MKHQKEHDAHVAVVNARIAAIPAADPRGRLLAGVGPILDTGLEILSDPTLEPTEKVALLTESLTELRARGLHQIAAAIFG